MKQYGFIGCGMMGQEHLRNIALLDDVEVTDFFEPDDEMAQKTLALIPKATRHASLESLLAHDLDAFVITSPNHVHADQLRALAANPARVLVEKPLCTTEADLQDVLAMGRDNDWWVAMEYRYMPPIQKLIEIVRRGDLGNVHSLSIREHRFPFLQKVGDWNRFNRNTGGTLVEKCCHFFDLMRHILQSDPVRIYASGGQDVNHLDERYDNQTPDILDNALVIVDFASGQRAMLELCMFAEGSRFQEEVCVIGSEAKVEAKVPGPTRFWNAESGEAPIPEVIVSPRNAPPVETEVPVDPQLLNAGDHNGSTFYQHQGFRASLDGGLIDVSLSDGAWAVRMGLAAQESIATGRAVDL